jgi:hypothetical protein
MRIQNVFSESERRAVIPYNNKKQVEKTHEIRNKTYDCCGQMCGMDNI